jgi:hypothetical protein
MANWIKDTWKRRQQAVDATKDRDRMARNAASLTALRITCHADAMDVFCAAATSNDVWSLSYQCWRRRASKEEDGAVTAEVSGVDLARILTKLSRAARSPFDGATAATAARLYATLAEVVEHAGPDGIRAVRIDGNAWEPRPPEPLPDAG